MGYGSENMYAQSLSRIDVALLRFLLPDVF